MATPSHLQMVKYGQSSIRVHNDDFADGYANGLLSDLDLLRDEQTPYIVDNVLSLDACEAYRLLRSLQETFTQQSE